MAAAKLNVIEIDQRGKCIHLYIMNGNDKNQIRHVRSPFKAKSFDDDFFKEYENALKKFVNEYQIVKVSLVLPDNMVFMDTIQVPAMGKAAAKQSVQVKINTLYKNAANLKISTYLAAQNRQIMKFAVVGIQRDLLTRFNGISASTGVSIVDITFGASATICGATMVNSKLKNGSYMLLDAKETTTKVIIVGKGRVLGFQTLPFGYEILSKNKPVSEDMLFDHSVAELAVINAQERAKAKALTMGETGSGEQSTEPSDEDGKTSSRKQARKLPKSMQRPTPDTPEGVQAENFRIFEKWALSFLDSNSKLVSLAAPDAIYVNLPREYEGVVTVANEELEENGIKFVQMSNGKEPSEVSENLELYGGYYLEKVSSAILL